MGLFARSAALSLVVALAGCAGVQRNELVATPASDDDKSTAELWAERKVAAELAAEKGMPRREVAASEKDPLAVHSAIEQQAIPITEVTPTSEVRGKQPSELNVAFAQLPNARSVDGAITMFTRMLGKHSWTEAPRTAPNAKRYVWIAKVTGQCHRLVLEPDGSAEIETIQESEWRMVAGAVRQNACTGEIKHGL
jgi:hypothetical protein